MVKVIQVYSNGQVLCFDESNESVVELKRNLLTPFIEELHSKGLINEETRVKTAFNYSEGTPVTAWFDLGEQHG